jgi:hypothetical protein
LHNMIQEQPNYRRALYLLAWHQAREKKYADEGYKRTVLLEAGGGGDVSCDARFASLRSTTLSRALLLIYR